MPREQDVAAAQAAYYLSSGAVPLVSRRAFEAVTGSKTEWWLVQTVALLLLVVGGALGSAARRGRVTPEIAGLGVGSAATLAAIEVVYAGRRRISPLYLVDAVLEAACVGAWIRALRS